MSDIGFLNHRIEVLHAILQSTYSQIAEAQQNVKEQAEIILKQNLEIIELSQAVVNLKKELAETQAEFYKRVAGSIEEGIKGDDNE